MRNKLFVVLVLIVSVHKADADAIYKMSEIFCVPEINYLQVTALTMWGDYLPSNEQLLKDRYNLHYGDFDEECALKDFNISIKVSGLSNIDQDSKALNKKTTNFGSKGNIEIYVDNNQVYSNAAYHEKDNTMEQEYYRFDVTLAGGVVPTQLTIYHCIRGACQHVINVDKALNR